MALTDSLDAATQQVLALVAQLKLSNGRLIQAQDIGSADNVVLNPTPSVGAYGPDLLIMADVAYPNATTTPKLNVSGLGQLIVTAADASALKVGALAGKCLFGFSSANGGGYVGRLLLSGLSATVVAQTIGSLHALTNLQSIVNTARTTLTGPGDGATWVTALSGTLNKVSATSSLAFWLSMPIWSPGPAAPTKVRVLIGSTTTRGVTSYSFTTNVYGQLALNNILAGIPAGSIAWSIQFSRPNDGNTWYASVNPTSADSPFYDASGTGTSLIYGEYEP